MNPSLVNGYAVLDGYGLAAATLLGIDFELGDREPMGEVVVMPRTRRFFTTETGYAKALMTLMSATTRRHVAAAA